MIVFDMDLPILIEELIMLRNNSAIPYLTTTLLACLSCFTNSLFALSSVEIEMPTHKVLVTLPVSISGIASATQGISEVLVAIRDRETGLWWQGDQWGEWARNTATMTLSTDQTQAEWQYQFDSGIAVGSGQYSVSVRVLDKEIERSEWTHCPFLVDHGEGLPFSVSVTSDLTDERIALPASFYGAATSPFGISSVEVGILDVDNGS
jgi:hypothetical protein